MFTHMMVGGASSCAVCRYMGKHKQTGQKRAFYVYSYCEKLEVLNQLYLYYTLLTYLIYRKYETYVEFWRNFRIAASAIIVISFAVRHDHRLFS